MQELGFDKVSIKFADRPDERVGEDSIWDKAESALSKAQGPQAFLLMKIKVMELFMDQSLIFIYMMQLEEFGNVALCK